VADLEPTTRSSRVPQANRIWFHLMGRGLVDPIDDFRSTNPASHPAPLDTLTGGVGAVRAALCGTSSGWR
jgi:hypothetical protein